MVIEAPTGGQIVYTDKGDNSLVDLLTKRFSPKLERGILPRQNKYLTI